MGCGLTDWMYSKGLLGITLFPLQLTVLVQYVAPTSATRCDSIEFRHRILANDMFSLEVLQQQSGNLRMHSQEMLKWANGYASQDLPSVFSTLRAPLQWLMLIAMEGPDKDVLCVERGYFRFCWAG